MSTDWFVGVPLALLAALLGVSLNAHAEPAERPGSTAKTQDKLETSATSRDGKQEAKRLYEQAAQAFTEKRNFEAIELFRQSALLEPSPLLDYNMALAYEEVGDAANALKHFRRYLASAPNAEDAPEVRRSIDRLEKRLSALGVQQLTVTSDPAGATLEVDGTPLGVTPYTAALKPGAHAVVVRRDGYQLARAKVELPSDRSIEIELTMRPRAPSPNPELDDGVHDSPSGAARIRPLTWGLMGIGVGSVTAGVLFHSSSKRSERERNRASSPVDAAEAQGAADGKQTAALVLLGAGGALAIAGGVLAVLDLTGADPVAPDRSGLEDQKRSTQSNRSLHTVAACAPAFCGVQVTGSF